MKALTDLTLDNLSPARLWAALDPEVRRQAGHVVFRKDWDKSVRDDVNGAIAAALRFRPAMVLKLPFDKRVDYLVRSVHPDDSLATDLLLALHLGLRRPMLVAFLDQLGIAHEDGVIADADELGRPAPETLRAAVRRISQDFPRDDVEVYLACLIAMDADVWGGLAGILEEGL